MARKFYGSLALQNGSQLQLRNSANTFAAKLQAPASLAADVTFSLPASLGSANQVMVGDGAGSFSMSFLSDSSIASNAAIALSKLAAVAAGRALVSDLNGNMSASNATAVEVGYLSGVTSSIQGQMDTEKLARQTQDAATLASAKSYTDTKVSDLVNAAPALLNTLKELADAINDDPNFAATVATNLGNEASARAAADTALGHRIDTEISDRQTAISGVSADLAAEVTARQNAIITEQAARASAVSDEASARAAGDKSLQDQLSALELSASGNIAGEVLARQSADNALSARLDIIEGADTVAGSVAKAKKDAIDHADAIMAVESAARAAADTAASVALANEVSDRQASETTINQSISSEAATRKSADDALSARVSVIEGSGTGSVAKSLVDSKAYTDSKVAALVNSAPAVLDTLKELADALNDDPNFATTVANQIGTEQAARQAADTTLQNNITSEANTRSSAISTLQTSLNNEITARQNADSSEATARAAADSAEQTARQAADTTLQNNINAEATARAAADATFLMLDGSRVMTGDLHMGQSSVVATNYIDFEPTRAGQVYGGGGSSTSISFTVPAGQTWNVSTYSQRIRNFQSLSGTFTLQIKSGATVLGTATVSGTSVKNDSQLAAGTNDYYNSAPMGAFTPFSFASPISLPAGTYTAVVSVTSGIFGTYFWAASNNTPDYIVQGSGVVGTSYKITNLTDGSAASDAATKGQVDAEAAARSSADTTLTNNLNTEITARQSAVSTLSAYVDSLRAKSDWLASDGATKTVSHNMSTKDVVVQVFDKADGSSIDVEVVRGSTSAVTLTASSAPGASGWRVLILQV